MPIENRLNNYPEPVRSAKQQADTYLGAQLNSLLKQANDIVFDMSEATSDNDQKSACYDAMSYLRAGHDRITGLFSDKFTTAFIRHAAGIETETGDGIDSGLVLVDNETLEQSLIINNMADKCISQCDAQLYALEQRLDYLIDDIQIGRYNNPLGPRIIAEAFSATVDEFAGDAAPATRLVFLKLFDRFVMTKLDSLYNDINENLAVSGVLPTIKTEIRKTETDTPRTETAGSEENILDTMVSASGETTNAAGGGFDALVQMMAQNSSFGAAGPQAAATPAVSVLPPSQHSPEATSGLLSTLSGMQQDAGAQTGDAPLTADAVNALIEQIRHTHAEQGATAVNAVDAAAIDIVGMIFEFILDDPNIHANVRALLARLQIPFIKLTLIEKDVFSNSEHPARLLLNQMAQAGIGWEDMENLEQDSLYKKISDIVERIILGFEDNVNIFQELLDEFQAFIQEDQTRSQTLVTNSEDKVSQIIDGTLQQKLASCDYPHLLEELLNNPWKDVLKEAHKADQGQGQAWNEALDLVDKLVWTLTPKLDQAERLKMARFIPTLLAQIQKKLDAVGYDQERAGQLLGALEPVHFALIRGKEYNPGETASQEPSESESTTDEITMSSGNEGHPTATWDPLRKEAHNLVKNLQLGDWVEFIDDEGNSTQGKLIWHGSLLDDYTFATRTHKIVADTVGPDLVTDFLEGRARLVESRPLLDRAIDAVKARLKR